MAPYVINVTDDINVMDVIFECTLGFMITIKNCITIEIIIKQTDSLSLQGLDIKILCQRRIVAK